MTFDELPVVAAAERGERGDPPSGSMEHSDVAGALQRARWHRGLPEGARSHQLLEIGLAYLAQDKQVEAVS